MMRVSTRVKIVSPLLVMSGGNSCRHRKSPSKVQLDFFTRLSTSLHGFLFSALLVVYPFVVQVRVQSNRHESTELGFINLNAMDFVNSVY